MFDIGRRTTGSDQLQSRYRLPPDGPSDSVDQRSSRPLTGTSSHVLPEKRDNGSTDIDLIGRPISFETGHFAGQTTKAELIEIQKADLGRKYARVDRRPLDPPPVVLFRLYQILDPGTDREISREIHTYEEMDMLGLVCTVDLLPVPGPTSGRDSNASSPEPSGPAREPGSSGAEPYSPGRSPPMSSSRSNHSLHADVVHYVGNSPITESSKCTGSLVGATFIQPNLVEYQGKKALVFVFADLAVKNEGNFILRYRVFDIYARPKNRPEGRIVMQAECYGGLFRVFSTKEFPGLQASTDLTKHLARWGVRLNIRETERKRRRKGELESPPYTTAVLKRRRSTAGQREDASDEDD